MQSIGLGKISVPTFGTPVPLASSRTKCHRIMVTYDPADGSGAYIYIKDVNNNIYAALSITSAPVTIGGDPGNQLDLSTYKMDASANSKGGIVGYDIE